MNTRRWDYSFKQIMVSAVVFALVMSFLLTIFVFMTGQTFGQRCKALGHSGQELINCVEKLANGK